ncbi:MAG TPA: RpiB/LacA/LacB family sugar-phosphate isomerase [Bacillota bacterium]|nr:RpiB/LacA/LacB family sugar-phosphate isomerase [Bacillota bacterium]
MIWLLVCSGNTCRSPMAAAMARSRLLQAGRPDIAVLSAGLSAAEGDPATPEAVAAVQAHGLGPLLQKHRAHQLDPADAHAADRIFAMTRMQAEVLRTRFPAVAARVETLDPMGDVFDPFGRGQEAYDEVLAQIDQALAHQIADHSPLRFAVASDATGAQLADALARSLRNRPNVILLDRTGGRFVHPGAFAAATAAGAAVGRGDADFGVVAAQPAPAACIAANRVAGARAAWCRRVGEARSARAECDANILCLSPRGHDPEAAAAICEAFLQTACHGGPALAWLAELRRRDAT